MTIQLEKVSIPYRYKQNCSERPISPSSMIVSIHYRYKQNGGYICFAPMVLKQVSIPYRYKQNSNAKVGFRRWKNVSIPYRYKQNMSSKTSTFVANSVSIPYRYKQNQVQIHQLIWLQQFQSPIGTNKTVITTVKEPFCGIISFNPLQVQTKLEERMPTFLHQFAISIPYRYKQNRQQCIQATKLVWLVSIPYRYKQNICLCLCHQ